MARQSVHSECSQKYLLETEADLLEMLLLPEEICYPWNPGEVESEVYFAQIEDDFKIEDWSDEELTTRSSNIYTRLNECWTKHSVANETLKKSLAKMFASRVPMDWVEAIANKAQQAFLSNLSLAEQMVQCVNTLLPNWGEDDLQVLARPLAYAMRGTAEEACESVIGTVRQADWTELSEMEQARLSMAIARSALSEIKNIQQSQEM